MSPERKNFSKNMKDITDLTAENCVQKLSPDDWNILF